MKKITLCLMATCLSFAFYPVQSKASAAIAPSSMAITKTSEATKAKVLLNRLNEINRMDKSNLKLADKKNLRNEVLSIRSQLNSLDGGIYISVGAVILIVIILVILL